MTANGFFRILGRTAAICVLAAAAAQASAEETAPAFPSRAETGWQAHALLYVGGEEISLEIYRDDGRERQETTLDGLLQVMIVRPSLNRVYIIVPEQEEVFDLPIDDAGLLPFSVGFGEVGAEFLGEDKMGEEITLHFRVSGPDKLGQHFEGEVWVTPDGIPLRMAGEVTASGDAVDFTIQLSLVSRGAQPDYLFAPPVEIPTRLPDDG
jgi:hypothetical protein